MASNHTENWGLNQWEAEDRVARADFNADNQKVEAALNQLSNSFVIGKIEKYDGNGEKTVDLGRQPIMVIVFSRFGFKSAFDSYYPGHAVAMPGVPGYRDDGGTKSTYSKAIEVTESGFTIFQYSLSPNWSPYYYLAIFDPTA